MKQEIQISTKKPLRLPARMFKPQDLSDMQVPFVENKILFNKAKHNESFQEVGSEIKDSMCVLNYPDCSRINFSKDKLLEVTKRQYEAYGDFIVLPYFKDETEYDINFKIELARKLKATTDKTVIFEVSYKIEKEVLDKIIKSQDVFDYLSIFYGVHYGRYPSFKRICEEIIYFKRLTGKKVFCMAIPFIFSGDNKANYSHFMPIWDLVCDGWVKNWRRGGSKTEKRLIDYADLKNKDMHGWLRNHTPGDTVRFVNVSVYSLFEDDETSNLYTKMLVDEVLSEVSSLTATKIEDFLIRKCPDMYKILIALNYIEKMILFRIREAEWTKLYLPEETQLLEACLHETFSPKALEKEIQSIESLASTKEKIPVETMIATVNNMRGG